MSTKVLIILIVGTIAMIVVPIFVLYFIVKIATAMMRNREDIRDEQGNPLTPTAVASKYGLERSWRNAGYRLRGQLEDLVVDFQTWEVPHRHRRILFPDQNEGTTLEVEFHIPMPPGIAFALWDRPMTDDLHVLDVGMSPFDRERKGDLVYLADDPDEAAEFLDDERIHKWLGFMAGLGDELDFRNHTFRWTADPDVEVSTVDWIFWHLTQAREAMGEKYEAMSSGADEAEQLPTGHW